MTMTVMQAEALDRARTSQALTNYPAIYAGFMAMGIPESDIKPRENVFTFHAWKALGRSVKKGEHGVKVVTFITCNGKADVDAAEGEQQKASTYRRPHTTTVFHISQTELTSEREARFASKSRGKASKPKTPQVAPLPGMSPLGFREQLRTIEEAAQAELMSRPVLSSWSAVIDYLKAAIAFEPVEHFHVLFVDKRNRLIAAETQQTGTVDHVPVYPREVLRRAILLGATAVILAHNHPSGDPTPSRADIQMTQAIIEAGSPLGIAVHDHIIVGKEGHASLKALKLIYSASRS
jgi:DNA repair protein RadC